MSGFVWTKGPLLGAKFTTPIVLRLPEPPWAPNWRGGRVPRKMKKRSNGVSPGWGPVISFESANRMGVTAALQYHPLLDALILRRKR